MRMEREGRERRLACEQAGAAEISPPKSTFFAGRRSHLHFDGTQHSALNTQPRSLIPEPLLSSQATVPARG